ncbi:TetR/AcrR family transcriptional regulator [Desulfovibrio gilichinskyi]|uniref:Transcriptional regulator, TetR family n=1 Tax=Desulfovibrio gilichinskyi TaxID=1519643 RepID=A0A1X7CU70_9BACT|nr:TetR/AcrR family transcriptional regulator [Desulfovibrio gilichinskyi]SMF03271.1 transcriptional regulator, TetR family [Desulfovibrio gilichinskyi]
MKEYSEKETRILNAAAEMFTSHPFHKVLLSDVAGAASVGKGTLYLYFKNKEELYFAVIFREFSILVEKLTKKIKQGNLSPVEQLTTIIKCLTKRLFAKATNVELLGTFVSCPKNEEWQEKRVELWTLIESVIVQGVEQGEFEDSNPRLTAQYIPGFIRSVSLFRPENIDCETIQKHACEFVLKGIKKGK